MARRKGAGLKDPEPRFDHGVDAQYANLDERLKSAVC
jgi:hypothetical protein